MTVECREQRVGSDLSPPDSQPHGLKGLNGSEPLLFTCNRTVILSPTSLVY